MMFDNISEFFNADFEDGSVGEHLALGNHWGGLGQWGWPMWRLSRDTSEPLGHMAHTAVSLKQYRGHLKGIKMVAEQVLIMHEECLQNNYSSIEKLRNTRAQANAVSQSRMMVTDEGDDSSDDSSDDDDGDEPARADDMSVDEPKPSKPAPDADGWTVVPPKRGGRGKN
uniref:Uncharacterized protein n=1 Tax=Aegilops tauschii TaxID=37682 RepID=R7W0R6_AEGTA